MEAETLVQDSQTEGSNVSKVEFCRMGRPFFLTDICFMLQHLFYCAMCKPSIITFAHCESITFILGRRSYLDCHHGIRAPLWCFLLHQPFKWERFWDGVTDNFLQSLYLNLKLKAKAKQDDATRFTWFSAACSYQRLVDCQTHSLERLVVKLNVWKLKPILQSFEDYILNLNKKSVRIF